MAISLRKLSPASYACSGISGYFVCAVRHAEESTDHLCAQCPSTMECWRVLNVQAATDHAPGMHNWLFAHMKSGKRMKYIYIIKRVKEK